MCGSMGGDRMGSPEHWNGRQNAPKLPGISVEPFIDHDVHPAYKNQTLSISDRGISVVKQVARSVRRESTPEAVHDDPRPEMVLSAIQRITSGPGYLPEWLKFSGMVLCFVGYYKVEMAEEAILSQQQHIVEVKLLYYLEDSTTEILYLNDDRRWKPYLKRSNLQVECDGSRRDLKTSDLVVGESLETMGREIHLVGADGFTREFMASIGIEQGESIEMPIHPVRSHRAKLLHDDPIPKKFTSYLMGLGDSHDSSHWYPQDDAAYNAVLRLQAKRISKNKDEELYYAKIYFYTYDNSLEMDRFLQGKTGPTQKHLSRSALQPTKVAASWNPQVIQPALQPQNLIPGEFLRIRGEQFLIYHADEPTLDWFEKYLGISREYLIKIQSDLDDNTSEDCRKEPCLPKKQLVHDEYNPLALHPDFLDIEKLQFMVQICRKSNSILSKTDSARRFLMSYYLHDGTISIFEQKNPTLGMSGGKYLERQKVYCHVHSKEDPLQLRDLFIGNTISIYGKTFEIVDADQQTLRYLLALHTPDEDMVTYLQEALRAINTQQSVEHIMRDILSLRLPGLSSTQDIINVCLSIVNLRT